LALQIRSAPTSAEDVARELERSIAQALPAADPVEVVARSPGHFAIRVVAEAFAGLPRVRQQQLVYAAIAHLMKGDAAPVHAIDELRTEVP
jgi:stress-induced morphogen